MPLDVRTEQNHWNESEGPGRSCQYPSPSLILFFRGVLLALLGSLKNPLFQIFRCNFSWGSVLYNFLKRGQCDGMERVLFWELHNDTARLLLLFAQSLVRVAPLSIQRHLSCRLCGCYLFPCPSNLPFIHRTGSGQLICRHSSGKVSLGLGGVGEIIG